MKRLTIAAAAAVAAIVWTAVSPAAEINVMSAGAVEPGLERLAARFRSETGHAVAIRYGTAPQLTKRLAEGEAADILIAPPALADSQVKAGKVLAEGRVPIGRVGVGVIVRSSAPAPDVASVDALKRALGAADSVVYNTASTGLYLEKLFAEMGLADILKAKTTRYANGAAVLEHVIAGKGNEIGFGAIPEIKMYEPKGLKLVAPLPAPIQNYTAYVASIMASVKDRALARQFIAYLGTPAARAEFAAFGVDP